MWVIAVGNPFDGLTLYGPYESAEIASETAEQQFSGEEWWVVELEAV